MEATNDERSSTQEIEPYYNSIPGLNTRSFLDLDDASNLDFCVHFVKGENAINLLVDFSDTTARVSCDLPTSSIDALIGSDRAAELNSRWISIWKPHSQQALLHAIGKRYGFSPRLLDVEVQSCESAHCGSRGGKEGATPRDATYRLMPSPTSSRRCIRCSSVYLAVCVVSDHVIVWQNV